MSNTSDSDQPQAAPTAPAQLDRDAAIAEEKEAVQRDIGSPDDERDVLIDGKKPGEDSAQ